MRATFGLFLLFGVFTSQAFSAIEIITERDTSPACEEFRLNRDIRIYKDPSLFLESLSLVLRDPIVGWEKMMRENPLLTTLRGTAQIVRLGPARDFKNFGLVARLYESVEPRLKLQEVPAPEQQKKDGRRGHTSARKQFSAARIVPVMLCGDTDAYRNTLGFILQSDLNAAQLDATGNVALPPSVRSIPEWKEAKN